MKHDTNSDFCPYFLRTRSSFTGQDRYGYIRIGEDIDIVEDEIKWVRNIFEWYIQKIFLMKIQKRLIATSAPKRGSSILRRIQWSRSSIQAILKPAREYAYGFKTYSCAGQIFHIPVVLIIYISTQIYG